MVFESKFEVLHSPLQCRLSACRATIALQACDWRIVYTCIHAMLGGLFRQAAGVLLRMPHVSASLVNFSLGRSCSRIQIPTLPTSYFGAFSQWPGTSYVLDCCSWNLHRLRPASRRRRRIRRSIQLGESHPGTNKLTALTARTADA